jgi:hypothetical protein
LAFGFEFAAWLALRLNQGCLTKAKIFKAMALPDTGASDSSLPLDIAKLDKGRPRLHIAKASFMDHKKLLIGL